MTSKARQFDALWSGILDNNGLPVSGGFVYTYIAGSSSVTKATYNDRDKISTASNPLILDAYGRYEAYGDGLYNIIVKDSSGVTLWDMDNIEIISQSANLILDGDQLTSQSVNGNIDIQPTGIGVIRLGGTNNGSGDAKLTTIQNNKDLDIEPQGNGLIYFNKGDTGSTGINIVLDEDTMASNRDDAVPTQQSVKTYVDSASASSNNNINTNSGYLPAGGGEFLVTIQSPAAMAVNIAANGFTWFDRTANRSYTPTSNPTLTITTAHASLNRWDLVQVNATTSTINVKAGTEASVPSMPAVDSGFSVIAYVYVKALATSINSPSYILNYALPLYEKNVNIRYKNNFSVWGKDGSNSTTEQQMANNLQRIPFGFDYDSVVQDQTFLHRVDTFLVGADAPPGEITFGGAGWALNSSALNWYGSYKETTTLGDTCTFQFSGVEVWGVMEYWTSGFHFDLELSSDGGSTWTNKRTILQDVSNTDPINSVCVPILFYEALPYGDYKVRLTCRGTSLRINCFAYTHYVCQRSVATCYAEATNVIGIDALPPTTSYLVGTWGTKGAGTASSWGGLHFGTVTNNDYIEFKFYGSKIWFNTVWRTAGACVLSFTIDGATTYCRNSGAISSLASLNNNRSIWLRLDSGSLPEGIHTVKITRTSGAGTETFSANGWSWYSAKSPTSISRDLICGESSEVVGVDNNRFSFFGAGWGATSEAVTSILRRIKSTTTQNDYAAITTPNDTSLRGIYLVGQAGSTSVEIKTTLGGSLTRYIYPTLSNTLNSHVWTLYDSYFDGPLHNQELRIIKNVAGNSMFLEAVIFEYGNISGNGSVFVMNKFQKYYNTTTDYDQVVSNTFRLDVYGSKSSSGNQALPVVHSGWHQINTGSQAYVSLGVVHRINKHIHHLHEIATAPLLERAYQLADASQNFTWPAVPNVFSAALPGAVRFELAVFHLDRVY